MEEKKSQANIQHKPTRSAEEETAHNNEKEIANLPQEVQSFVKGAPPEIRQTLLTMMLRTGQSSTSGHPLFRKFSDEHISKFLDYCNEDDERAFRLASSNRWFTLLYTAIAVGVLIFLITYLLPNNADLLSDILKILISLGGGFGMGYGYKSYKNRKK